ncbi:MAG TPA: toxin-antitoxin system YwqK family antitoxin [Candidatus Omnitrophota bacterium]|jgi:hypothetical protein|nr:toxin-antitoxin system YwqK family antitoxin [Candidatus Omnitrophota bacterium]HSA30769.1 toxin-antitoxin system YwqK family antitoxin [Candidatus Omnitrophota bacterium]
MPVKLSRKKKRKQWVDDILFTTLILIPTFGVAALLLTNFENSIFDFMSRVLAIDTRLLFTFLFFIFIVCGTLLFIILQWADRDNVRFKMKRDQYRSQLVCRDYYGSAHRFRVDKFIAGHLAEAPKEQKIDIDHSLRTSDFVATDQTYKALAARKTDIHFEKGKLHGTFKTHFASGSVLAEINYEHGRLHGPLLVYYPNGALHNEKHFRDGKLNGIFRAWDEDGALFFEIEFKDDLQHGFDKTYQKGGVLEYEDTFVNGKRILRKTFDSSGKLKFEQSYLTEEFKIKDA